MKMEPVQHVLVVLLSQEQTLSWPLQEAFLVEAGLQILWTEGLTKLQSLAERKTKVFLLSSRIQTGLEK